jgi:hypothetical protein
VPKELEAISRRDLLPKSLQQNIYARAGGTLLSAIDAPEGWETSHLIRGSNYSRRVCIKLRYPNGAAVKHAKAIYEKHFQILLAQRHSTAHPGKAVAMPQSGSATGGTRSKAVGYSHYLALNAKNGLEQIKINSGCATLNTQTDQQKTTAKITFTGSDPATKRALEMVTDQLKLIEQSKSGAGKSSTAELSTSASISSASKAPDKVQVPVDDGRVWSLQVCPKAESKSLFNVVRDIGKLDVDEAKRYKEVTGTEKAEKLKHTVVGLTAVLKDIALGVCGVVVVASNEQSKAARILNDGSGENLNVSECILQAMRAHAAKAAVSAAVLAGLSKSKEALRADVMRASQANDDPKRRIEAGGSSGGGNTAGLSKNGLKNARKKLKELEAKVAEMEATRPQRTGGFLIVGLARERLAEALKIHKSTLEEIGAVLAFRVSPLMPLPQEQKGVAGRTAVGKGYTSQLAQQLNKLINLVQKYGKVETLASEAPNGRAIARAATGASAPPAVIPSNSSRTTFKVVFCDPQQPVGWTLVEDSQGRIVVADVSVDEYFVRLFSFFLFPTFFSVSLLGINLVQGSFC